MKYSLLFLIVCLAGCRHQSLQPIFCELPSPPEHQCRIGYVSLYTGFTEYYAWQNCDLAFGMMDLDTKYDNVGRKEWIELRQFKDGLEISPRVLERK